MEAPKHWAELLQATWPDLYFKWNGKAEKWEVWCSPSNGPKYRVHTIQDEKQKFRPIDNRVFATIARNDLSRHNRGIQFLDELDKPIVEERRLRMQRETEHNYEYAERLRHGFLKDCS